MSNTLNQEELYKTFEKAVLKNIAADPDIRNEKYEFLDVINNYGQYFEYLYSEDKEEQKKSAETIETYVIDNTVQIKYNYQNIGFGVILTDKEIVDFKIETILKDKVSTKIEEIDYTLNDIENTAKLIMEKFDNDKK